MRRGSLVLAALPVLVLAALLLLDRETAVLGLLSDDAFYYLKIAHSIAAGLGSSFDGLAPTNGYHPLWMLCVVALEQLTGGGLWPALIASMLLSALVAGLTLALLLRAVQDWAAPGHGALALAFCCTPLVFGALTNGLETGILLLSIALFVWCSLRYGLLSPAAGARARFALGLLLGLLFLCRLDSAFVVLAAGVLLLASGLAARVPLPALGARLSALVAGVLLLALPFFAWNKVQFGHLSPISGLVKSTFPALRPELGLHGDMRAGLVLVGLVVLLALAVAALDLRRGRPLAEVLAAPLSILAAGALAHFAYALLFMSWGVYWWHFVVGGAALALGAAQLCQRLELLLPSARPALRSALPVLVALAGLGLQAWLVRDKLGRHREWYAAARWAREHTSPDALFAMKDAGLFGYFSERRVVNLDGKANGYEYLERLERGEVRDYLRSTGVGYVADVNATYSEGRAALVIPRVLQPGLLLWMPLADEVYRGAPYSGRAFLPDAAEAAHFAIWSFRDRP
jgi:hypothetical protein